MKRYDTKLKIALSSVKMVLTELSERMIAYVTRNWLTHTEIRRTTGDKYADMLSSSMICLNDTEGKKIPSLIINLTALTERESSRSFFEPSSNKNNNCETANDLGTCWFIKAAQLLTHHHGSQLGTMRFPCLSTSCVQTTLCPAL